MLRHARLAEHVGLDSFWIAEHHFAEDGYMAAVIPVCAGVLGATDRLIAGTSVAIASSYNPIRLAVDAIAADLLSGGRFILGLGTGYRPEEFAGMAIAPETDEPWPDEVAEIPAKAFTGRPFAHRGRFYDIPRTKITPAPFTLVGRRIMLAGDGAIDRDAVRAAERGKRHMIDPSLPPRRDLSTGRPLRRRLQGDRTMEPRPSSTMASSATHPIRGKSCGTASPISDRRTTGGRADRSVMSTVRTIA